MTFVPFSLEVYSGTGTYLHQSLAVLCQPKLTFLGVRHSRVLLLRVLGRNAHSVLPSLYLSRLLAVIYSILVVACLEP